MRCEPDGECPGPRLRRELFAAARAERIRKAMLQRAFARLGCASGRTGFGRHQKR